MQEKSKSQSNGIGTLGEKSLHAELKAWFSRPGDQIESLVDGYHIDVVRANLLVEIQTKNFSAIKNKLASLLDTHQVLLIHPLPREKWIIRKDKDGTVLKKRKSPKYGRTEDAFREFIRIPKTLTHPNLTVWLVFVQTEEIWVNDGQGSWRRKHWSIADQKLIKVLDKVEFNDVNDYQKLIPKVLPANFTNKELSRALNIPITLAGKMTYCLRKMNILNLAGKKGNANLYQRNF